MPSPDPKVERIVGGLLGLGIVAGVLILSRRDGTSADTIQEWQGAIVASAAAAGLLVLLLRRRK